MTAVAYLVSEYPAPSHTFIRREVAALRAMGREILTFSVRPASETLSNRADAQSTKAILGRPLWHHIGAVAHALVTHPLRFMATLVLAWQHRAPGLRSAVWSLFHFVEAMQLVHLLRQRNVSAIHSHFANNGATIGLLAANFLTLPWSLTLHGISETDYPAGVTLREKLCAARFVACASYFMRAQAMRITDPVHWSKLHIVRCGIDFAGLPNGTPGAPAGVVMVAIGRLSPEKGFVGLIETFALVIAQHPGCRLRIVGSGEQSADLQRRCAELGLTNAVEFLGALPEHETLQVIAAADALVLPSFMEGLPVVLIEAMALGKPVVASSVAGIPELVENNENGMLFPASDWNSLYEKLLVVVSDAAVRKSMGAKGRVRVQQEFDINRSALMLNDLFGLS